MAEENEENEQKKQSEQNKQGEQKQQAQQAQISYDDFAKLDLRVARILKAERVEGADKLLKLTIRVGTEERTLAAGIAQHYAPEELEGKLIVVVANLAPRTLRGITSQGMLLAAANEDHSRVILLGPDKEIEDGSKVS